MRIETPEQAQLAKVMQREIENRADIAKQEMASELATALSLGRELLSSLEGNPDAVAHLSGRLRSTTLNIDRAAMEFKCHRETLSGLRVALVTFEGSKRRN
jgi:hypothetical protein